jgi:hypothetical protein
VKTKTWIVILVAVTVICLGLSLWLLLPREDATAVKVISQGKVLYTLLLSEDTRLEIVSDNGTNVVTVKDGKVAVTQADCPDQYCVKRGWCSGGTQIVCLPNRLVLEFVGQTAVDGVAG